MQRTVIPVGSSVTRLAKSRLSWTWTNRICFLQQLGMGSSWTGNRTAKLAVVVVSSTCLPALLWNNKMASLAKLDQLRQKWRCKSPRTLLRITLRLSWVPRVSSISWQSMPGAVRAVLFIRKAWACSSGFIMESMMVYSLMVTLSTWTGLRGRGTNI